MKNKVESDIENHECDCCSEHSEEIENHDTIKNECQSDDCGCSEEKIEEKPVKKKKVLDHKLNLLIIVNVKMMK